MMPDLNEICRATRAEMSQKLLRVGRTLGEAARKTDKTRCAL